MNSIYRQSMRIAWQALKRNKLRAILSVLGTSIGIMSLIVILSAGESFRLLLNDQLTSFGTDYIEVEIKVPSTSQTSTDNATGLAQGISITTLSLKDKESIDKIYNVKSSYGAVLGQTSINTPFNEKRLQYFAVSHEFQDIDPGELAQGRFFSKEEDASLAKVVIIGSKVAKTMFPNQDPIGQTIKIQKVKFRVIGVYEERGSVSFFDMDNLLYVPLRTAQKLLLGFDHLSFIFVQVYDTAIDEQTAEEIRTVIRANHDITDPDKDDFAVMTQGEANATIDVLFSGITLVLSLIASVALLVGGVGIMNIMYVAVNERVFEIGLRKAVGAHSKKIKNQFLIEAIMITLLGGLAGLIIALFFITAIYIGANYVGFSWPFAISIKSIIISVIFSSAVGLVFGYYPAKRAAQLSPVEALRARGD